MSVGSTIIEIKSSSYMNSRLFMTTESTVCFMENLR